MIPKKALPRAWLGVENGSFRKKVHCSNKIEERGLALPLFFVWGRVLVCQPVGRNRFVCADCLSKIHLSPRGWSEAAQ